MKKPRAMAGRMAEIHTMVCFPVARLGVGVYKDTQKGGAMELETNSRKLLKVLKDAGFEEVSKRGSHLKLRKGNRTVIVPHPKKDLPEGTVRNIYQQAGLL